ncbi:LuxR family transcriptional regulator [Gordonia sp. TBRC 11910]|uniref:LuxR family transcriptional regulator n=1 Tax=Gordonia asplenii TaxID=2725283 RepID=A0A848KW45_9ACTN|nr:LuxR C-terminal-related transcriptional regulator [Gordonia asplenii]NMO02287.1 LuxR family transcriptional regulator [Gordonia asplenii]
MPQSITTAQIAHSSSRTRRELDEVADLLGIPQVPAESVDAALAAARRRAEQEVSRPTLSDDRRLAACRALYRVHQLQTQRLRDDATSAIRSVGEVRHTVDDLLQSTTSDLITEIPARVCRGLSFGRAMLSSVHAAVWLPKHLHFESDDGPDNTAFRSYVTGAQISLADAPLESSVVRTRTPSMTSQPDSDRRTFKEIVAVAHTVGYVVAPIVSQGRVIAILHVDRPTDRQISATDLSLVAALSECLSSVFERAILADRLARSSTRVDEMFGDITAELTALDDVAGPRATSPIVAPVSAARPDISADVLTSREREVLGHIAIGATNAQIARSLVISEETVKSHVKQITRKLGTSTRSAAVARFVQIGGRLSAKAPA